MNTNEQQAQRDKLIELATAWSDAQFEVGKAIAYKEENDQQPVAKRCPALEKELCDCENAERDAEKAFRDYVEHMHEEAQS